MSAECNADLGHPCNAGATEDDPWRACADCRETAAYYTRLYGGLTRSALVACDPRPLRDERLVAHEQELRDAGRRP